MNTRRPHYPVRPFIYILLLLGIFIPGTPETRGQDRSREFKQVTTHPAIDYSPAVSPDGHWLAFTSERSGNLDVWVKELPRGRTVQVTTHRAEDSHPAWSPDGKKLVFVSKRRDALGDIWIVDVDVDKGGVPKKEPIQLTRYLGTDNKPTFLSDGKHVVFASDRDGMLNLWMIALSTMSTIQLTVLGGMDGAASPVDDWILFTSFRSHREGDLYFVHAKQPEEMGANRRMAFPVTWGRALDGQGTWSPDGKEIVFLRFDRDTNGDDRITPEDNGSLWQKKLVENGSVSPELIVLGRDEIQITTELYRDAEPCWSYRNEILFSSTRGGGMDVWSVPCGGLFIKAANASDQYVAAMNYLGEATTREALFQSILGYTRVEDHFPGDSTWVSRSLVQISEVYQILKDDARAEKVLSRIKGEYKNQKRDAALAELKLAVVTKKPLDARIAQCRRIIASFPEEPSTVAEAWIVLGDFYREADNREESLAAYSKVVQSFPELPNFKAQALIRIGDLFQADGQGELARQSYLSAIRQYGEVPLWRERAGERLLGQIKGSSEERIRGLQQIIQEVPDDPSLVAKAQLTIGRILVEGEQYAQALRELERIPVTVPSLRWAHAEAKILQARIYGMMGEDLRGTLLLEEVIASYESVEGGRYASQARETLFELLVNSADGLKDARDFRLAEARYRKALELRPEDIRIHRGLVESVSGQGRDDRIEALIQEYEEKLERRPGNPVLLYGLGLTYSYYGENRPERLERSNALLLQALAEDYRLIYPYRTLSYNYERLERLEEEKALKEPGRLIRIGRTIIAPLRWVVGLLPFGGEKKREGYYEKAIQALTTALELNDEKTDPQMEAVLTQNLANNFYKLGEFGYRNAYRYYRMRLSLDSTFAQLLEKAVFFERMGHCGVVLEDMENADGYLLTAIRLYTELERERDVVRNFRMLAFLYQLAGRYEEAIGVYEQTLPHDERQRRWDEIQRSYRNIAYNYYLMGEPEDALKYAGLSESILLKQEIPMKPSKKSSLRIEVFGFSIPVWSMEEIGGAQAEGFSLADEAAFVYGLISRSMEEMKSFPEAVAYEQRRLEIFQKRKDRLAERISLNRLGSLYYMMADYDEAWSYFYRSWRENKKRKDGGGCWVNVVNLGNVATVELTLLGKQEHTETTIACLVEEFGRISKEDSTSFLREKTILMGTLGTLWTLRAKLEMSTHQEAGIGIRQTLEQIQSLQTAETYLREGIRWAREGGYWREEGIYLKNIAEIEEILGDDEAAYEFLRQSYWILENGGEEELLWRLLYGMAGLASRLYPDSVSSGDDRTLALVTFEQAMEYLESLPVQEEGSEERLADREERWNLYVDAAFEWVRQDRLKEALETMERGLEKRVADMMSRRPPMLKKERHKIAWGNLRYLQSRIQEIRREIREVGQGPEADLRRTILNEEKERYEEEYRQLLNELREEDAVLAYLSGVEPVNLERVLPALPEYGGVLCYLMGKDETLLWAIDTDTIMVTEIAYGRSHLTTMVKEFLQRIEKDSLVQEMSRELYDILLRPAASFIDEKNELIVIPDEFLWDVPFEGLSDGEESLLEKLSVVYTPSLTAYRLAWAGRRINQDNGLLIGDALDTSFQKSMERGVSTQRTMLGDRATESAFREALSSTDIIQIERWMMPDEKNPLISALVFAPDETEDGYVRVADLFSLDIRASMVFLPPPLKGRHRGVQIPPSFFHGFLYAGVPSIIVPRWHVERRVKEQFLDVFYSRLGELSVSDAVSEAQLAIRQQHPGFKNWAAFQLLGFEGMDSEEKVQFAQDNLRQTLNKGWALERREEFTDAAETYERAQDMAEAMGDSSMVYRIRGLIIRASEKGKLWGKAVAFQKTLKAAAEKRKDRDDVLSILKKMVTLYMRNGEYDRAAQSQSEAIALMEDGGFTSTVASAYEDLAFIYVLGRQYQKALDVIDRSYMFYQQKNDTLGQGRAMIRKGRFLLEAEKYWDATRNLGEGILLLERYLGSYPVQNEAEMELAAAYQLNGLALEKLTQYEKALDAQEKGMTLFSKLGMSAQVIQGHQYIANLYWARGDYRRALSFQNKALEGFAKSGDQKLLAVAYSTLGLIHMGLGDLPNAMKAEEKALEMAEKSGSLEDKATILKNMGLVAIQEGDIDWAFDSFDKASRIDSSLGFRRGLAYDFRNLGMLMVRRGSYEEGIPLLEKGLRLSREIGNRQNEVQCLYRLGEAFAESENRRTAVAYLDSSIALASGLAVPEIQWRILRQRANVLSGMGREEDALADYVEAVDIVEGMRAELKVEAYMQGFLDDKIDLYVDVVRLLLRMDRLKEAFDFVERAKSRNFIDLLANEELTLTRARGDLLNRERAARVAVQEAQERIASLGALSESATRTEREEKEFWEKELSERRKAYEDVLTSIQAESPELASFVSVDPYDSEKIQEMLPDSTALVEYFLTKDALYCWILLPDRIASRRIEVLEQTVAENVKRLRQTIQAHLSADIESRELYESLIRPIDKELNAANHVIFVPHGVLHYLPFGALQDEDGGYLIDRFSMSLVPSATVLGYCIEKGEELDHKGAGASVLALSNPDLGNPIYDLPFAEKEVKSLRRTFGKVTSFYGSDVTERIVRDYAISHDVIHLACHGTYEPESPLFSALMLSPDGQDDGRLEAHEIFGLELNCDLVTLSACETGLAQITQGDEIIGLARSFIFAGAPSIITSLWKVDDLATAVMIKRFYRYWISGYSKAEALRRAQILVRDNVNAHPAAWAAFGLTGDFQ